MLSSQSTETDRQVNRRLNYRERSCKITQEGGSHRLGTSCKLPGEVTPPQGPQESRGPRKRGPVERLRTGRTRCADHILVLSD